MSEKNDGTTDSAGEFDPYSFAEQWYYDHPEVLDRYIRFLKNVGDLDEP